VDRATPSRPWPPLRPFTGSTKELYIHSLSNKSSTVPMESSKMKDVTEEAPKEDSSIQINMVFPTIRNMEVTTEMKIAVKHSPLSSKTVDIPKSTTTKTLCSPLLETNLLPLQLTPHLKISNHIPEEFSKLQAVETNSITLSLLSDIMLLQLQLETHGELLGEMQDISTSKEDKILVESGMMQLFLNSDHIKFFIHYYAF